MAEQVLGVPNQTPYDLPFRLFGVPTRTHPLFWLMAALIGHSFAGDDLLRIAIAAVCIFFSILVHEFGHALSGRYFGDKGNSVVLYMMGGLCISGWRGVPSRWPRIAMIFWGPLAGLLLAGITFGMSYSIEQHWIPLRLVEALFALEVLIYINVFWSLFNLLPVYPLDGGQILRESLMWKRPFGGEALAFLISMISGILVAIGAVVYYVVIHNQSAPVMMIAMMLYFSFQSWQMRQRVLQYGSMSGEQEEPRAAWEQDPDWWKKR